ncbi:MAG TPA: hypothetical protein VHA52_13670 [Candidatus Babeliaceae bacterium]|nr:hypothetical protein [Candidatus Babeliaceae bacterium]
MKILLGLSLLVSSLFAELGPMKIPLADQAAPQIPSSSMPQQQPAESTPDYGSFILNEFKLGYFRSGDKRLRHTFDKGLLDIQLSSSFRFWDPLYIYGAVEYIGAEGRTVHGRHKVKIREVPLSLGLQYMLKVAPELNYYVTLGPRYFFVHLHETKHGFGGFVNTGLLYFLTHQITVNFIAEYSYKRMQFDHSDPKGSLQVGGLMLGGGLGYFW